MAATKIHRFWWIFLSRGVVAVLFGIAALFWPEKSFAGLIYLIGGYLVFDGLSGLVSAIGSRSFGADLIAAVVSLVAGAVVFFWTDLTTNALVIILGLWALANGFGLARKGLALSGERFDGSWLLAAGGVLGVFGLVALFWRSAAVTALSWLLGLAALSVGLLLILAARKLEGMEQRLTE